MSRNLKYVIKLILSGVLLFAVLAGYNLISEPKYTYANSNWPTTSTFNQFYKMERNSVDVLFFGSSFAVNAFDPQKIYEASGIRSYNLGSEQQSIFMSYWWLKEALRFQSPKAVVLETRYAFYKESNTPFNMNESFMRKSMDPMKWSKNKMDAVHVICAEDHAQSEMSYYFTNLLYHGRWKELTKEEVMMDAASAPLKGFSPLFVTNTEPFEPVTVTGNEEIIPLDAKMKEYLGKIADLCRENGIELILVTVPATDMHPGMHRSLQAFADEYGISYYDYAEKDLFEAAGWNLTVDNPADHMNWHGAEHMSEVMAEILQDAGVQPCQNVQWESERPYHAMILEKAELSAISYLSVYLDSLNSEEQILFLSRDPGFLMNTETVKQLEVFGIPECEGTWVAVVDGEQTDVRQSSDLLLEGRAEDGLEYTVFQNDSGTAIILNGSSYMRDASGLHITVYDRKLRKVIDEVCFVGEEGEMYAVRD